MVWKIREVTKAFDDGHTVLVRTEVVDGAGRIVVGDATDEQARLIAAAPDLLAALKAIPVDADFGSIADYTRAIDKWWVNIADPAIRKAEASK